MPNKERPVTREDVQQAVDGRSMEFIQIMKDISDYLAPFQTPYEQAIYHYLFRWSHLETGASTVRRGKGTIATGMGRASGVGGYGSGRVSYGAVVQNLKSLEKKGHIRIGDTTREGTIYTILIPLQIKECVELKSERERSEPEETDYFNIPENRIKIFERDSWACHYCGERVTKENATLDHLIPVSKGGGNSPDNLVTSCLSCNAIKAGKDLEEAGLALWKRLRELRGKPQ